MKRPLKETKSRRVALKSRWRTEGTVPQEIAETDSSNDEGMKSDQYEGSS